MANYDTGQDLLGYVLRRAGDILPTAGPTDASVATSDRYLDAKLTLNQAYLEICALKPWRWNRKRTQFLSLAEITRTVTSISSATVTLSAIISASMTGRKFMLDSEGIPFRISAHTAASDVLTLAVAYSGSETSGAGTIFQDEITVATDILAFPQVKQLHLGDELDLVPEEELNRLVPRNASGSTRARKGAFISASVLRIAPWTTEARLFECTYNYRPSLLTFDGVAATDTPILPQEHRVVIGDRALEKIYADKRDARTEIAAKNVAETFARMSGTEITFGKPRVYVKRGQSVSGY